MPYKRRNTTKRSAERVEGYGSIRYFDDGELTASPEVGNFPTGRVLPFFVAACIIAFMLIAHFYNVLVVNPGTESQQVDDLLNRTVDAEVPVLGELVGYPDQDIYDYFEYLGYHLVNLNSDDAEDGIDVFRTPSDVDTAQADELMVEGISSLSTNEAALILNGSWRFTTDRSAGNVLRIRYADFTSATVTDAVNAAASQQLLAGSNVLDNGTDDSGNTYRSGTVSVTDADGETVDCTWRISVIALDEMYDVGLPEPSWYVGVRLEYE